MLKTKGFMALGLVVLFAACHDVTAPAPSMSPDFRLLFDSYWKDSLIFNAPSDVTGFTGYPLDGCVGRGFSHIMLDASLPAGERDTILVIQMNQGQECPDARYNSYSWMLSFVTRRPPGYGYPITITGDTMLFVGTFADSNHWSGKIVLAIAKTQIGTWTRTRMVPSSLSEALKWAAKFDSATKDMKPGMIRVIRPGRYAPFLR